MEILSKSHCAALTALLLVPTSAFADANRQQSFRFQSGFWINLHHFLLQYAVERSADDRAGPIKLTREQASDWDLALSYYREQFEGEDLLRRDMAAIKNALADAGNERSLDSSGLDSKLVAAVESAAPIYRAVWWQGHDRSNRSRIDQLLPLLARHEDRLKVRLSDIYRTGWPESRIRTDVVFHANWAGAYTTLYPTRITISSQDSSQPPQESLEILFHEASHALIGKVRASISEQARSLGKLLRRKALWHAVLFYSTGEVVRQRVPGHTPYAVKHGLWERTWPDHLAVLEKEWKPYLDGNREFDAAIGALVEALVVDP